MALQDKAWQGRTSQDKARLDRKTQDKAWQCKTTRQGMATQDNKTRQGKDKARQGQARQDNAR